MWDVDVGCGCGIWDVGCTQVFRFYGSSDAAPSSRWHFMYWDSPKSLPQETTVLMEAKQNISDRREVLDKCGHFINGYFHLIPLFVSPILQYNGRSYVFHLFYMKVYIFNLNSLFFWLAPPDDHLHLSFCENRQWKMIKISIVRK